LECALRGIPNDYSHKLDKLRSIHDEVELLILGDSHLYFGINPMFLSLNSFNNAHIAQTLDQDFALLKKNIGHLPQLKYVIIPLSINSLYTPSSRDDETWRYKNYAIYYGLSSGNSKAIDYSELLSGRFQVNLKRLAKFYFLGKDEVYSDENGFGKLYSGLASKNLEETAKKAVGRLNLVKEEKKAHIKEIEKLITLAFKNQVHVILLTTPVSSYYQNLIGIKSVKDMVNLGKGLDSLHSNLTYLNFYNDTSLSNGDFYDADHLNGEGARKLSKLVNKELKELGIFYE